jgi:hypothetical protein
MPDDDTDNQHETGSGPAAASSEGRAHAGESGAESGSGSAEPSPSDMDFNELWGRLKPAQQEYVLARQKYRYKNKAAQSVDVHPDTVYGWPDYVEAAVDMLRDHRKDAVQEGMKDAAVIATQRLQRILNDDSITDTNALVRAIKLAVEQEVGKATQQTDLNVSGGFDVGEDEISFGVSSDEDDE